MLKALNFKINKKAKKTAHENSFTKKASPPIYVLVGLLLFFMGYGVAWVFYKLKSVSIVMGLLSILFIKTYEKKRLKKVKAKIEEEFYDLNQLIIAELESGIPIKTALMNIEKRLGKNSAYRFEYMEDEIIKWVRLMNTGERIEEVIRKFAEESEDKEIIEFSNLISISTRNGGNLIEVIRSSNLVLNNKREMRRELSVLIAEKKFEQTAMTAMPLLILLMLQNLAPEFIEPLYTTMVGRISMTALLAIQVIAFFWSKRLADLK